MWTFDCSICWMTFFGLKYCFKKEKTLINKMKYYSFVWTFSNAFHCSSCRPIYQLTKPLISDREITVKTVANTIRGQIWTSWQFQMGALIGKLWYAWTTHEVYDIFPCNITSMFTHYFICFKNESYAANLLSFSYGLPDSP